MPRPSREDLDRWASSSSEPFAAELIDEALYLREQLADAEEKIEILESEVTHLHQIRG